MHCPFCEQVETKVVDSRLAGEGSQIRRRRECVECSERFTTFESAELVMPHLIKNDETRVPFDEAKLRRGLTRALEKRPVKSEAIEAAVSHIMKALLSSGERDVPTAKVGELVMHELRELDQVAYVRFASVYRSFKDVEAFRDEIEKLQEENREATGKQQLSLLNEKLKAKK